MEITQFLLARIAEDLESMVGLPVQNGAPTWHWPSRARIYRDLCARRRIVAYAQHVFAGDVGEVSADYDDGYIDGLEWSLRHLALPYEDHPDYDPAWARVS